MDDLSASSWAHNRGVGVRLVIHFARQAVQFAYANVESEDANTASTYKLGIAHAYLQLSSSLKRSANACNFVMDVRKTLAYCS